MAPSLAPISSDAERSSVPSSASVTPRLSAVWPPTVGSMASGRFAFDDLGATPG